LTIAALEGEEAMLTSSEKDWIFISDAHFTGRDPEEIETFLRFLDSEKERIGYFVILGDLFEFFFGFNGSSSKNGPCPFPEYLPIFERLQMLHRRGIRIKYFEGNHDFFLHSFFSQQFGMDIEVYPESYEERLEGKRTFIAHGDLSNPNQWRYRIFRRVLKHPGTYRLIHFVGPRISRRVAKRMSDTSYQKYHNEAQATPPPAFKTFARRKFLEGFEIVILGHSHFPEEIEEWIDGKRYVYFNVGDWKTRRSFLRFIPPDHFQLERFA
jgi:UDP-2,3-diacylglucosamine hydrolase